MAKIKILTLLLPFIFLFINIKFVDSSENCQEENECRCPEIKIPVCASNGKTFLNACKFNCENACNNNITIVKEGFCELECDPHANCNCNYNLIPICGTDQITYSNPCILNCAVRCSPTLRHLHFGPCRSVHRQRPRKEKTTTEATANTSTETTNLPGI